jgi:glycosyltransferase involved in cell wall biosynthesis
MKSAEGKGAAVREGLLQASGSIILIQDADLEYDTADYPRLLDPILSGQARFVLGTRHKHGRAMRSMNGNPLSSLLMNAGHRLFLWLFNRVAGTALTDPFTMYKVFRRSAIDGMEFHCRRFDFDIELSMRLIQAGNVPLEIPVSYRSRSFQEGKKVRWMRDPITWLLALWRLRRPLHPSRKTSPIHCARISG